MAENETKIYKVLDATGLEGVSRDLGTIGKLIDINIDLVGTAKTKNALPQLIEQTSPEIVLISDSLFGDESNINLLSHLKASFPEVRYIYFVGEINHRRDSKRVNALGHLVLNGIYDIIEGDVNPNVVAEAILNPQTKEQAGKYTADILDPAAEYKAAARGLKYTSFSDIRLEEAARDSVVAVWSTKPGTGKSFIAGGIALALALHSEKALRIALIDGDMQTLSLGTNLGIEESKDKNLYVALKAVRDLESVKKSDEEEQYRLRKIIKDCFVKYPKAPSLYTLTGSAYSPQEISKLEVDYGDYGTILEVAAEAFDIVIVDLNSNPLHQSSYVTWSSAKELIFVMNLDYNNVRNNIRYKELFKELNIADRVKYIVNQNVENTSDFAEFGVLDEPLQFTADTIEEKKYFDIYKRVNNVPYSIQMNCQYRGEHIMLERLTREGKRKTAKARLAIMDMANDIYPLDDYYKTLKNSCFKQNGFFSRLFKSKPKFEYIEENDPLVPIELEGESDGKDQED